MIISRFLPKIGLLAALAFGASGCVNVIETNSSTLDYPLTITYEETLYDDVYDSYDVAAYESAEYPNFQRATAKKRLKRERKWKQKNRKNKKKAKSNSSKKKISLAKKRRLAAKKRAALKKRRSAERAAKRRKLNKLNRNHVRISPRVAGRIYEGFEKHCSGGKYDCNGFRNER